MGPGVGVSFGDEEFESAADVFDDGEQGDGAVLHGHLDGEAAADFAVIDLQRSDLGLALGDAGVAGAVVTHEDDVVVEVDGVVLGEGTAGAEGVHDLHGEDVFDFVLAGDRDAAAVSMEVPRMMEVMVSSFMVHAGADVEVGERRREEWRSARRSRATAVRAARSSSSGGQSVWTSNSSWNSASLRVSCGVW